MLYADTDSVKTEKTKQFLNSLYGQQIYGEDDMKKRKFIVVHRPVEEHKVAIVFCDSISAYTDNEIRLTGGSFIVCIETGREICELLHAKGVI